MKAYLYAYYNFKGEFFKAPWVHQLKPDELIASLKESFYQYPLEVLQSLKEDHLYYIGIYDTSTADIVYDKRFLFDISSVALEVINKKIDQKEGVSHA